MRGVGERAAAPPADPSSLRNPFCMTLLWYVPSYLHDFATAPYLYDVVVVRALVLIPVGPGLRAVPMLLILVPFSHVFIPVGPGVRAVSMHLSIAPRAYVRVSTGPDLRAVPILIAVAPHALIVVSAVPFVSAQTMLLVVAPRADVAVPVRPGLHDLAMHSAIHAPGCYHRRVW